MAPPVSLVVSEAPAMTARVGRGVTDLMGQVPSQETLSPAAVDAVLNRGADSISGPTVRTCHPSNLQTLYAKHGLNLIRRELLS